MRLVMVLVVMLQCFSLLSRAESPNLPDPLQPRGGRDYIDYPSPVKSEKGVTYREYRAGPKKGRVEKLVNGQPARTWMGKKEAEEYLKKDIILHRQNISLLDSWKMQNDWMNAESLRRMAEEGEKSSEASGTRSDNEESGPRSTVHYAPPYSDGFNDGNTLTIRPRMSTNAASPNAIVNTNKHSKEESTGGAIKPKEDK